MKRILIAGGLIGLIMAGFGAYWIIKTRYARAVAPVITSTSFSFSGDRSEIVLDDKKTGIAFPGTSPTDVEVRLGNSINFKDGHPDVTFTVTIKAEQPVILTKEAYEKLRTGMTYPQVAEILGGVMTKGRMSEGFWSTLELIQGTRRVYLKFEDDKVTEKSAKGVE
jgi:hypothetical protein